MCIILDANCFGKFLDESDEDMNPIRTWLNRKNENAKIAHSPTGKLKFELSNSPKMLDQFNILNRKGNLKIVNHEDLNHQINILNESKNKLKSDDLHIVALALAGNVKVLASMDEKLGEDFKTLCNGKIYKNSKHKHLLYKCKCK